MAETKKPGRPPGSKNREYAHAKEIPATCPKCGSAELRVVKGARAIDRPHLSGLLPDGTAYRGICWTRKQCSACGQLVSVRKFFPVVES